MAGASNSVEPNLDTIDPAGDLILHVSGKAPSRLLVSSKAMTLASKPFAAMLGPTFMEGQSLSIENPPTIEFPEDRGDSFRILMLILHHRCVESSLPDELSEPDICRLLVIANKYDCVQAIRPTASERLRVAVASTIRTTNQDRMDTEDQFEYLVSALNASFMTRDAVTFREVSLLLMLRSCPHHEFASIISDPGFAEQMFVPGATWTLLSELRALMRADVFELICDESRDRTGRRLVKMDEFQCSTKLLREHEETEFNSLDQMLLSYGMRFTALHQFTTAIVADLIKNGLKLESAPRKWTNHRVAAYEFAEKIKDRMSRFQGLCLDCAVDGQMPIVSVERGEKCQHRVYLYEVQRQGQEQEFSDSNDSNNSDD